MLAIIMRHAVDWGKFFPAYAPYEQSEFIWASVPRSVTGILTVFFASFGTIGVDVFVLISGYFSVKGRFNPKRIFMIIAENWFFSILFLGIFLFILKPFEAIGLKDIIKNLFPTIYGLRWFIPVYIVLQILSPFINKFIQSIKQNQHLALILILVALWSVIPSFLYVSPAGSSLGTFVTLYLIGAYLRLYPPRANVKKHALLAAFWAVVILISEIALQFIFDNYATTRRFSESIYIPALTFSIEILILFIQLKPRHSRVINYLSGSMLGVYIIHENSLLRLPLWGEYCNLAGFYGSKYFLPAYFGVCISVMIGCVFIEVLLWRLSFAKLAKIFYDALERKAIKHLSASSRKVGVLLSQFI
jgi:surface polysaccharide O-acyltransferase-like enzyme